MPVTELVSEVSRQVLEWLHSYGTLWDEEKATLRLVKVEKTGKQYRYHYSITLRTFHISAADVEARA
jgi:hypothetical protein